jgi:hypothetical protein
MVAVELSIQGTFPGPLETPGGIIKPTGAKVRRTMRRLLVSARREDREVQLLIMFDSMRAQMGVPERG